MTKERRQTERHGEHADRFSHVVDAVHASRVQDRRDGERWRDGVEPRPPPSPPVHPQVLRSPYPSGRPTLPFPAAGSDEGQSTKAKLLPGSGVGVTALWAVSPSVPVAGSAGGVRRGVRQLVVVLSPLLCAGA